MLHTNLPKYLSDSIALIQNRVLKSIFPGKSYNAVLNDIGLRTLTERRGVMCIKCFTDNTEKRTFIELFTTCTKEY